MILAAPLTRVKEGLEALLFGFAALTQLTWITFTHDDDKSTVLTLLSLVLCSGMIYAFAPGAHSRGSSGRGRAAQIR